MIHFMSLPIYIFSGHGFGINTNIFETNVINLAIVIAVVISFVGDALRDVLNNRKQTILDNLNAANARVQEMEDKLKQALSRLEKAQAQAAQIDQQTIVAVERETQLCIAEAEEEAARLKKLHHYTIRSNQQKSIQQISRQMVDLALKKARERISKQVPSDSFQIWVSRFKMKYFRTLQLKKYSKS